MLSVSGDALCALWACHTHPTSQPACRARASSGPQALKIEKDSSQQGCRQKGRGSHSTLNFLFVFFGGGQGGGE